MVLNAMVIGIEVECRIGNAVYPAHYDRGWHITGTAGVFGTAAASGKLLGLTVQQMVWALGLVATQLALAPTDVVAPANMTRRIAAFEAVD